MRRLPLRKLKGPGDRVYRWVAANRTKLSRYTTAYLPWGFHPRARAGYPSSFACLFFLGYIAFWNLKTLPQFNVDVPPPWNRIASVLRLDQKWNMFAPHPTRDDGWYVIEGELRDGTKVDVWRMIEEAPSYEKPSLVSEAYDNARWRKYMMNIWKKSKRDHLLHYGRYLCRLWNRDPERPESRKLQKFQIHYMLEKTPPPGEPARAKRATIWRHRCIK